MQLHKFDKAFPMCVYIYIYIKLIYFGYGARPELTTNNIYGEE